jgi:hypothetical protein
MIQRKFVAGQGKGRRAEALGRFRSQLYQGLARARKYSPFVCIACIQGARMMN